MTGYNKQVVLIEEFFYSSVEEMESHVFAMEQCGYVSTPTYSTLHATFSKKYVEGKS